MAGRPRDEQVARVERRGVPSVAEEAGVHPGHRFPRVGKVLFGTGSEPGQLDLGNPA
jgi:hypothetical protein